MTNIKSSPWYARRLRWLGWASAAALLALPAIAMQAGVEGVHWTASDFLFFAIILLLLGGAIELSLRGIASSTAQLGRVVMAITAFLTVWINLAVGMVGDGLNAQNGAFLAIVPAVAIGAAIVGGGSRPLAMIAFAAAAVQSLVAITGLGSDPVGARLSMMFALPWLAAGLLLRASIKREAAA